MEGGIAIILILFILVAIGVAAAFFGGVFGGTRAARKRDPDDPSSRPIRKVPNPEQQAQEKGTLFPPSG
jgi:hypothetical protein